MKSLTDHLEDETIATSMEDRMITEYLSRKPTAKKRRCLMCDKLFASEGPYNRRCPKCNRTLSLGNGKTINNAYVYKIANKGDVIF